MKKFLTAVVMLGLAVPLIAESRDRAHFASSTDWFIVDNYPTPKKADPKKLGDLFEEPNQ
jgi:hypothetical protein